MNFIYGPLDKKGGGYEGKPNDQINRSQEFLSHGFLLPREF